MKSNDEVTKESNSTSNDNRLDSHIAKTNEQRIKYEKQLENETVDFDLQTKELDSEIRNVETATKKKINDFNIELTNYKNAIKGFFNSTKDSTTETINKIQNNIYSIRNKLLIILGIFIGVFILSETVPVSILKSIKIADLGIYHEVVSVGITTVVFLILIFKTSTGLQSKLAKLIKEENEHLLNFQKRSIPVENFENVELNFENTSSKLVGVKTYAVKIITTAFKQYAPGVKEYYSSLEEINNKENFVVTLRNALKTYGVDTNLLTNALLEFKNNRNSENEWLDDISKQISDKLNNDPEIIRLCYYDYVEKAEKLKDSWQIICDLKKKDFLISLLMQKVNTGKFETSSRKTFSEIIENMKPFTIGQFTKIYDEFYLKLEKERKIIIQTVTDLGFTLSEEDKNNFLDYFPGTAKYDDWFLALISKISTILNVPLDILGLLYLDKTGNDKKLTIWKTIEGKKEKIEPLVDTLYRNNLFTKTNFGEKELKVFCNDVIKDQTDFSLSQINKIIVDRIQQLNRVKSLFAFSLEGKKPIPHKIKIDDYDDILIYDDDIELVLAKEIEKYIGLNFEIILLFYYDYTQSINERKQKYDEIKSNSKDQIDDNKIRSLTYLLFDKGIVSLPPNSTLNDETENLYKIMMSVGDFDVENIRKLYYFYKTVLVDSEKLINFLIENQLNIAGSINIDYLIQIFSKEQKQRRYDILKTIVLHRVLKSQKTELNQDQYDGLIEAILVLFSVTHRDDQTKVDACRASVSYDIAVKILHTWIKEQESEKFSSEKIIITNILDDIIKGIQNTFDNIHGLMDELQKGSFPTSIRELMGSRFDNIEKRLDRITEDDQRRKIFERIDHGISIMMKTKIKNNFITQAINSQLISAYMITLNQGRVMDAITKGYLEKASRELAKTNKIYENIIMMETAHPTSGRSTRIGLVPLHMRNFGKFTTLFNDVFNLAVKLYTNDEKASLKSTSDFSANLIRIFPSEFTFKPIHFGDIETKKEHDPIESIKELIREKLSPFDKINVITSAQQSAPTIALRDVIFSLFDSETSIYLITEDLISNIVKPSSKLDKIMDDRELAKFGKEQGFDSMLKKEYGVSHLTELAVSLNRRFRINEGNTENSFIKIVEKILASSKITLEPQQLTEFCRYMLNRLVVLGDILSIAS